MITLETTGLVNPDAPVPININQILDLLQGRQDRFSVSLVDALRQLQLAVVVIWAALQSPDEIQVDSLIVTDGTGALGTTVSEAGVTTVSGTRSGQVAPGQFQLQDTASGTTGYLLATVVHDTVVIQLDRQGTSNIIITLSPSQSTVEMPAGGQIKIGGNKVLTDRQSSVTGVSSTVTGTAGATYTATEQSMINQLKTQAGDCRTSINNIIAALQAMGILA